MNGKPLLRDFDAIAEPGFDHPPADKPLQSSKHKDAKKLWLEPRGSSPFAQK